MIWRDSDERARGMLCHNQELGSPVNGVEVSGRTHVSRLLPGRGGKRHIAMEDRKDCVNHIFESLPGVTIGGSGWKVFQGIGV